MKQLKLICGILLIPVLFFNEAFGQTLPYTFQNSSRYTDNEIYIGLVGKFPGMGDVWMNMTSSQLQVMSYSNNTVPGPAWANTPDGKNKYAAMFFKLSDIPNKTIQIPQGLFGCRILISFKSPMYIYFHQAGGYAGADLQNPTDPNDGIRWELVELTWGGAGLWTNTSRVDSYQYPMGLEVTGYTGGISGSYAASYNARINDGSAPNVNKKIGEIVSHQTILNSWTTKVQAPFYGCKVTKTHSMDGEPIIEQASKIPDFKSNGAYKDYFASYIDDIWSTYSTKDLYLNIGDRGTWRGRVTGNRFDFYDPADGSQATIYWKPTTQDAIEGAGALATTYATAPSAKYDEDLMIQAQVCAAINRHAIYTNAAVGEVQYNADNTRFFKVAPFNQYVNFFHSTDISYQSQTYAFAYDDVGDQSSTIQCTFPTKVKVVIGGYGEVAATPITVPGKIEAEAFSNMSGIQTETTADVGGGSNIGYIDANDWTEYDINVTSTGTYDIAFRTASLSGGGALSVWVDGVSVASSVAFPVTGDWQTWATTIIPSVPLTQGNHKLKLLFTAGAFNLNYINVTTHDAANFDYLHASGKNIVNNAGNLQIRAINIGNYMIQEGYMLNLGGGYQHIIKQKIADVVGPVNMEKFYDAYKANFLTKADIDSIAKWGFNTIRLPLHYNLFAQQGSQGTFIESGFTVVDQIISWCKANHIYVILDLHAAPGGQNSGDISDYVAGQSSLWEDVAGSTYTSAQNRSLTIALWKEFARRYANEPTVGGYDLINETNWTLPNNTLLMNLMKDITTAIRTYDKNHIVFIEGNSYANDYNGLTPKWDNNMAYSFHKYWNDVTDASLNFIFQIRDSQNVPVWMGEFGENSNHWIRNTVELMNQHNIGWAVWPYKKMASVSGAVSFKEPANWSALAAYINGGAKPSAAVGQAVLDEMAENVKLANCSINQGYLFALFANDANKTKPFISVTLPARIKATQYDEGKNGMSYSDAIFQTTQYGASGGDYTAWNTGWYLRNDGVDIQYSTAEQTAIVGWTEDTEWMNYTVQSTASANYRLSARVAGTGGKLSVMLDGNTVLDRVVIPSTGGWDTWSTVDLGLVNITSGSHVLKMVISTGGYNLNYIDVTPSCTATITSASTSFCDGGSVVLTASAGASYKWMNGTTQVGTASTYTATTAGSYTVEVTNASGCKATSAAKVITLNALPTATITSPSTSFCQGGSVVLTASADASYKWMNGTTQVGTASTYTATTAGSYTVEVTNTAGCKAISAAKVITVDALPTATITSSSTSFCQGGNVVLTASAGSSYKWVNGTTQVGTASTYTATAAGSYTVEVTNASGCKTTSAAKVITVDALPTATITSPSTSFCQGGSVVLTASAGSSYKWMNGTTQVGTASTYTATTAGSYTVEVTNAAGCKATSVAKVITVDALPTATISSASTSFCDGGSLVLTASAGTSYKWMNGTTQVGTASTYTATTAGSYTVEVTNAAGCKAISVAKVITVDALPTATITSLSSSFCQGGSVVLTASAGSSYKWMNGTTQVGTASTYTATTAGSYTVEVTNAAGCKATSAVKVITVDALPTATITSPASSFCEGGNVVLTASAGTSYKWMKGTTQVGTALTYTATAAGSYTVEVTNAAGCKAISAAKAITVDALPTATITSPASSFCEGGNVVLTASAGTSYKWMNGTTQVGTASTYTATAAGSYTVEVANAAGCKATSVAKVITVNALPTATITSPASSFCQGGNVVLTASAGTSYKWMNGTTQVGTASTYTATTAGSYTVEVTNAAGCKAISAAKVITVDALPTATITSPASSFCQGGSVVLTASAGTSYKWMNGTTQVGTASTYTATTAGSYTVEVTNTAGCKAISVAKVITVDALPTATITSLSSSFCQGGSVVLTASAGTSYKWMNGTTQVGTASTYTATTAGSYTVEVTNAAGCKATSAVKAITVDAPTATITSPATSFCEGGSVELTANAGASYKWLNGTTEVGTASTYTATTAGSYTVEVTNAAGCKAISAAKAINQTTSIIWYADVDNDGKGDPSVTQSSCTQPQGYVSVAGDGCPADVAKTEPGNCGCGNTEQSCVDCAGVANGTAALDVCNICSGGTTGITPKVSLSECTATAINNPTAINYISVYPNPFENTITIDTKGVSIDFYIYDASGALIETISVDGSAQIGEQLKSGIYLVRYRRNTDWQQFKMIKM